MKKRGPAALFVNETNDGMRGRAATYTLQPEVVVRGVTTGMPFSLLWCGSIVGDQV
jgi:hypothetical protein